jgi:hypothetical protein
MVCQIIGTTMCQIISKTTAILVGCALRREELAVLDVDTIQLREGRRVLADLEGKGRRVCTVAIPAWVKQGINAWMTAAGVEDGRLLRAMSKGGKVKESMSGWAIWSWSSNLPERSGPSDSGRMTCAAPSEALPQEWRKYRIDQVPARSLLYPDNRTLPLLGAEDRNRGER